jgi:hypothetical protein
VGDTLHFRVVPSPWQRDWLYPRCRATAAPHTRGSVVTVYVGLANVDVVMSLLTILGLVLIAVLGPSTWIPLAMLSLFLALAWNRLHVEPARLQAILSRALATEDSHALQGAAEQADAADEARG